jgi:hypothetical protein
MGADRKLPHQAVEAADHLAGIAAHLRGGENARLEVGEDRARASRAGRRIARPAVPTGRRRRARDAYVQRRAADTCKASGCMMRPPERTVSRGH